MWLLFGYEMCRQPACAETSFDLWYLHYPPSNPPTGLFHPSVTSCLLGRKIFAAGTCQLLDVCTVCVAWWGPNLVEVSPHCSIRHWLSKVLTHVPHLERARNNRTTCVLKVRPKFKSLAELWLIWLICWHIINNAPISPLGISDLKYTETWRWLL